MWLIGVEVEQETSAPPPKNVLDPPLPLLLENTRLEIYKAFQGRLTCLNRHMIVQIS